MILQISDARQCRQSVLDTRLPQPLLKSNERMASNRLWIPWPRSAEEDGQGQAAAAGGGQVAQRGIARQGGQPDAREEEEAKGEGRATAAGEGLTGDAARRPGRGGGAGGGAGAGATCDHETQPHTRILITLNFWYWVLFSVRFQNVRGLDAKIYVF